jgi:hypothetical protein
MTKLMTFIAAVLMGGLVLCTVANAAEISNPVTDVSVYNCGKCGGDKCGCKSKCNSCSPCKSKCNSCVKSSCNKCESKCSPCKSKCNSCNKCAKPKCGCKDKCGCKSKCNTCKPKCSPCKSKCNSCKPKCNSCNSCEKKTCRTCCPKVICEFPNPCAGEDGRPGTSRQSA